MEHVEVIPEVVPDSWDSTLVILKTSNQASSSLQWVLGWNPERGGWEFPGGHKEQGESYLETAKREALEEAGVTIKDIKYLGYYCLSRGHVTTVVTANLDEVVHEVPQFEIERIEYFDQVPAELSFDDNIYSQCVKLALASE